MKYGITVILLCSTALCAAQDHFARARELYQQGPSKAPEILAELNLELKEHPENINAYILKAITQMGIERLDDALKTLDVAEKRAQKDNSINPEIPFYRARCLFFKRDFSQAKKALEPYSGFFLGSKEEEARYDKLMNAINAELKATKPNPK